MSFSQARRQASPVMSVWREPEVVPESGAIQVLLGSYTIAKGQAVPALPVQPVVSVGYGGCGGYGGYLAYAYCSTGHLEARLIYDQCRYLWQLVGSEQAQ